MNVKLPKIILAMAAVLCRSCRATLLGWKWYGLTRGHDKRWVHYVREDPSSGCWDCRFGKVLELFWKWLDPTRKTKPNRGRKTKPTPKISKSRYEEYE